MKKLILIKYLFIAAVICLASCSSTSQSDTAYRLGYSNYIEDQKDSFLTVLSVKKSLILTTQDGIHHNSSKGKQYLILTIQFDFSDTDYSLVDIVKASECFVSTDFHSFDSELTDAINGFELKNSQLKKGEIEVIDIVDESFTSEYMSVGIVDKYGISQNIKYAIM